VDGLFGEGAEGARAAALDVVFMAFFGGGRGGIRGTSEIFGGEVR